MSIEAAPDALVSIPNFLAGVVLSWWSNEITQFYYNELLKWRMWLVLISYFENV